MKTKTRKTFTIIALIATLTAIPQYSSAQGFLNKIKKAVKKVENTLNTVSETVNSVGETFSVKDGQSEQQAEADREAKPETRASGNTGILGTIGATRQKSQSATSVTSRKTKITSLGGGDKFTVTGLVINNVGMGMPIVRLHDSGIFLSNTGVSLIGKLSVKVNGLAGKRLIMLFEVLDENGESQSDNYGNTAYAIPLQVSSSSNSYEVEVRIPYGWIDLEKKPEVLNFGVTMMDFSADEGKGLVGMSLINMDPASISINHDDVHSQAMSDIFGGGSAGGIDLGGIVGAMLGGGTDTAEHTCMKCDGTGLCEYCDGDGFLNPSVCRKCAQNPGICRHCQGTGTTTVKLDIDKSGW